jgi:hypothetical protein
MRGSHPLILGEMALIKDLHTAILIHFRVPRSGQNAQIGHFGLFFESTHFLSLAKTPSTLKHRVLPDIEAAR